MNTEKKKVDIYIFHRDDARAVLKLLKQKMFKIHFPELIKKTDNLGDYLWQCRKGPMTAFFNKGKKKSLISLDSIYSYYAISYKGTLVGIIRISIIRDREGGRRDKITVVIKKKFQSKKIGTAAVLALVKHKRQTKRPPTIIAKIKDSSARIMRFYKRCGFVWKETGDGRTELVVLPDRAWSPKNTKGKKKLKSA